MHIGIGRKKTTEDLVDLLLECHGRIRNFSSLAKKLADTPDVPRDEVIDVATRIARYFGEALPLHVEDEERSIVPRLKGRDPDVDRALANMHEEHEQHAAPLSELLSLCSLLRDAPERHRALAPELARVAERLVREFEAHLAVEEAVVFPALRRLDDETRATIVAELRARRRR